MNVEDGKLSSQNSNEVDFDKRSLKGKGKGKRGKGYGKRKGHKGGYYRGGLASKGKGFRRKAGNISSRKEEIIIFN
jgi:hypothetical protein